MKKITLLFVLLSFSFASFAQNVNITFELNTATLAGNIDASGLYVAGGSGMGVPGDHPLTDPDGDGIYTVTVTKPVNFSSHFIFLNGNCSDWSCKENIAGLPCGDPANWNDRFLPPVTTDTTIKACFGTCDSDGTCTLVSDSVNLTFELNTSTISVVPQGVFIAGGGNFGNPGDYPMADPDGDGIYTITFRKAKGFLSYYTFTNGACGDWSCKEDLTGLSCGDPNNFNDRLLPAIYSDTTIKACFGMCQSNGSCDAVGTNQLTIDENLFELQPTLAQNYVNLTFGNGNYQEKQITIFNAVGQVVFSTSAITDQQHQVDVSNYINGMYFITVNTENTRLTRKFVVAK